FDAHLRRAEHVSRRMQRDGDFADPPPLAVLQRLDERSLAHPAPQQRGGRRGAEIRGISGPRVIAVSMGDHGALHRPERMEVERAARAEEALGRVDDHAESLLQRRRSTGRSPVGPRVPRFEHRMAARISDYAIVGDCRSAALISRDGSLDWLCWPRFDSPSIFAAILDEEQGGRFRIAPAGAFRAERGYAGESNVLRTRFLAGTGELELTDFMPVLDPHQARRVLRPECELLRIARCLRGEIEVEIVFDPRPRYAAIRPRLESIGRLGLRV